MTDSDLPPETFATAEEQLHDAVTRRTGLSDFGDDSYRLGLRVLLHSMDYDPIFSPEGRASAWGEIITVLSARAIAARSLAETPGVDEVAIRAPVVITGIPRTGTTALHKLMAVDPQFQGLQNWLANSPMPRPPRESWGDNQHFRAMVAELEAWYAAKPNMRAAHNMVAEEVDECLEILRQTFVSNRWSCGWSSASYDAWWQAQSEAPSYDYLKRILQLVGRNEPDKRWLLKNPGHIANLDLLFAIFPDALVIQTHRDPSKAVPSLCALLLDVHCIREVGRVEQRAHHLGFRETAKWAKAVRDADPVRQRHRDQIIDVVHGDFHRAPMEVIDHIYATFGLQLTPEVEADMAERIAAAPELAHGAHRYDLATFGISREELLGQFGDYVDRFDLRPGTGA
jgi:hypothetical protein